MTRSSQKSTLNAPVLLMSRDRVQRVIHRMAYQIAEDNRKNVPVLMLGIKERGYVFARQLASAFEPLSKHKVQTLQLVEDNADGVSGLFDALKERNPYIVLADDVVFSGRTLLRAISSIMEQGAPRVLRTAVLVDRGHRSVPVEASFKGLQWPTKLNEHVRVITHSAAIEKVIVEDI